MKLNDYQVAAMATAVYPEYVGLAYTSLGLAGEAGEIANKVKKVYRDNDGELTRQAQADLMDELGDVLWYVAALATENGISLEHLVTYVQEDVLWEIPLTFNSYSKQSLDTDGITSEPLYYAVLHMCNSAGNAAFYGVLDNHRPSYDQWERLMPIEHVLHYIARIALILGVNLDDVAAHNLEKLAARKARNAINGTGDKR